MQRKRKKTHMEEEEGIRKRKKTHMEEEEGIMTEEKIMRLN